MSIDVIIKLLEDAERIFADNRHITKFNNKGIPYLKRIETIGGVRTITNALRQRMRRDKNPIIVVGDMSGMADLNNKYGREKADIAIEKTLRLFSKEMKDIGLPISPSGDEMWLLPDYGVGVSRIVSKIKEFLIKLNKVGLDIDNKKVGLNAKFFVGKKPFSEVEGLLKFDDKGEKLPPGTIKLDKDLIHHDKDKTINDPKISDAPLIPLKEEEVNDILWGISFEDIVKKMSKRELILKKNDIEHYIKLETERGNPINYLQAYLQELLRELKRYK